MATEQDVLREIEELLKEGEEYDPADPRMDERWVRFRQGTEAPTLAPPARTTTAPPPRTIPKVGAVIQRSDAANASRPGCWRPRLRCQSVHRRHHQHQNGPH